MKTAAAVQRTARLRRDSRWLPVNIIDALRGFSSVIRRDQTMHLARLAPKRQCRNGRISA
jgi:hypothetical protein